MSLFKARDWWETTAGGDEQFDLGCLCIGDLDSSVKVFAGSYNGILRIYSPGEDNSGFKPQHLLLEQNLNAPIIQLACGKFISGVKHKALAVLHPRKLCVFTLASTTGQVQHGSHYKLSQVYQHNMQRTSFNMCYGPFGQVQERDFICVQSMDGTLSVYEQEAFSFTRFLPGSLLPGPLDYVRKTDSFVTVSSSRQLESYKYQVLAVATDTKTKEEAQNLKSGKRVAADWSLTLGEQAICLEVVNFDNAFGSVMILGERNVFCVTEFGKLRFMMKMEYNPRCMKVYGTSDANIRYIVGTDTNTLLIYTDTRLVWSAQMNYTPVQIDIIKLNTLPGGIVTLTELGHLGIHYLGTDPAMMVIPSSQYRETKYDEWQSEIKNYQQIIREKSATQAIIPSKPADDEVSIIVHVPSSLDSHSKSENVCFRTFDFSPWERAHFDLMGYSAVLKRQADGIQYNEDDPVPSITIVIELKAKMMTQNVKLNVHINQPLATKQTEFCYPSISANQSIKVSVPIFMKYNFLPASLSLDVSASYSSATGAPRIAQSLINLPLKLVVKPAQPVKSAMFKVTIDTNKPPVNLNDIFFDLLGMNAEGQGSALGFQFFGGPVVTLLASKTSQRYRLQSDDFASMWLIAKELIDRLHKHYGRQSGLVCSHSTTLPLQEYFESVDAHFEYRLHAEKYKTLLEQRASQFRAIQRRLLTRFKDKTPSPLANLDALLEGTYRQMVALAEHAEDNKKTLYRASTNLSSATSLINLLVKLMCNMSEEEFSILNSVLTPNVLETVDQQGWEETVDTALTHQLRTTMSKTVKDQTINIDMLPMVDDTTKLKKHIAIFIERLAKGTRLIEPQADTGDSPKPKASSKVLDNRYMADLSRQGSTLGAGETPKGTKLGEKLSPRAKLPANILLQAGSTSSLPPLRASAAESDLHDLTKLPPLQVSGLKPLRNVKMEVPDLDELINGPSNGHS